MRLCNAVKSKMQRDPELQGASTCNVTYGEMIQALKGLPEKGNLDMPLSSYKAGHLPRDEMEQVFDEFFGGAIVQDFSIPNQVHFMVTINVARLNKVVEHESKDAGI